MDIHVTKDALLIDDKDGAFTVPLLAQDAVLFCHRTMRVKITQERIRYATQAVRPGFEAGNTVHTKTQDLGLHPFEPVQQDLVGRDLSRSDRGPRQGEESKDNVTTTELGKTDFPTLVVLEGEIGSFFTNTRGHMESPCALV